jgi:hypothetical protein
MGEGGVFDLRAELVHHCHGLLMERRKLVGIHLQILTLNLSLNLAPYQAVKRRLTERLSERLGLQIPARRSMMA